ncbi:Asp23/Gls24 family envelope stress response protein [Leucobacter weissii]|uniref:Asp23/Gls24 family envelope stress response protein n=1 Tax=Leucobacter weissii TaxID=1983706 RepID=A0A939MIU1_9MICO|nr:Asp23/Gls24 family envelope stress response protein [Leucobacter weissii]MBO1901728.1 Asp23/Gls24 family envelope stress response protein [Leucobacter weissii]
MTHAHDARGPGSWGVEPDDLDGHTLEELAEYLDGGRTPANPSIDASPGCRLALDALARLRALSPELLAADTADEPVPDEHWVQGILAGIRLDARAGRRIPIPAAEATADLGVTEGAVRGLIRAAEETVPGALVGRCRLSGEVAEAGAPIRVQLEVSVPYGDPIPGLVERLRAEIAARLALHTPLNVAGIDIAVQDVRRLQDSLGGAR